VAGAGLNLAPLDPAARRVLEGYLAELTAGLVGPRATRTGILFEVVDGLAQATAAHQARGVPPSAAARAAVADFGDARQVAAGFGTELAAATGRRVGLGLLASGPLVGLTWLAMAAASAAAPGPEPSTGLAVVVAVFGVVLAVAVPAAVISVLATGRLGRRLPAGPRTAPTAAGLAAGLCVAGDLLLLSGLVAWAVALGGLVWPLAVTAAAASITRLTLSGRALGRCLAARRLVA
jgi:hypothetical protein